MDKSSELQREAKLIQQAQGDTDAFLLLYDRYVDRIFAYAYRRTGDEPTAKDVTSATFEKALRSLKDFQWRGISFGAWLYRIASNEIGKQQHRNGRLTSLSDREPDHNSEVEALSDQNEQSILLQDALHKLSAEDQTLITLSFFEELPSAEIAQIVGCSVNNCYLRVHRALKRMRKQLDKQNAPDRSIRRQLTESEKEQNHADAK